MSEPNNGSGFVSQRILDNMAVDQVDEPGRALELAEPDDAPLDCSSWAPMHDTLIVHWPKGASMVGSIHMPTQAREVMRPARGVVLRAGPGRLPPEGGARLPMQAKEGDTVVFSARGAVEHEEGGKRVYLMSEMSVYAIITTSDTEQPHA